MGGFGTKTTGIYKDIKIKEMAELGARVASKSDGQRESHVDTVFIYSYTPGWQSFGV